MVLLGWDGGGRARTPGAVGGNPELTGLTGELLPLLLLLLLRFWRIGLLLLRHWDVLLELMVLGFFRLEFKVLVFVIPCCTGWLKLFKVSGFWILKCVLFGRFGLLSLLKFRFVLFKVELWISLELLAGTFLGPDSLYGMFCKESVELEDRGGTKENNSESDPRFKVFSM